MSKFESETFSANDFINKLKVDLVGLKNFIKENQSNLTNGQIKRLEKECEQFVGDVFSPSRGFPLLSEFLIKLEYEKIEFFNNLNDFDQKTEKLKKLEKQWKKEENDLLKDEINQLKISRDIEKQKFSDLIQKRNEFNKELKNYLKKENLSFHL